MRLRWRDWCSRHIHWLTADARARASLVHRFILNGVLTGLTALGCLSLDASVAQAQWITIPCPSSMTRELNETAYGYTWEFPALLSRTSASSYSTDYSVTPYPLKSSNFNPTGMRAYWFLSAVKYHCLQRTIGPIVSTLYNPIGFVGSTITLMADDQLCDEEGNYVDYGGTPCDPSDGTPTFGGTGGSDSTNDSCSTEYIYIDYDPGDGSGWRTIWEGYVFVC